MLRQYIAAKAAAWALHPNYAAQMAALAFLVDKKEFSLSGDLFAVASKKPAGYLFADIVSESGDASGRIAVHDIEGALMREDGLCSEGMATMGQRFQEADADEQVVAHVLRIHSPGGTVSGTETFARIIGNADKPVVVHTEMAYSAAYWIASAADFIMLAGETSGLGSIGVQMHYLDYHKALEKEGVKEVLIRATTSPDKNKYGLDPMTEDDVKGIQTDSLDPLDRSFMAWVRENRPQVSEDALTGATYYARQALDMGLADYIGSFEDALTLAADMAGEELLNESIPDNDMTKLNRSQAAATEEPQVDAVQTEQAAGMKADQWHATLTEMQGIVERQSALIKSYEQTIQSLKTENERLSALPATDPEQAVVSPAGDTQTAGPDLSKMDAAERKAFQIFGEQAASSDFLEAVAIGQRVSQYQNPENR